MSKASNSPCSLFVQGGVCGLGEQCCRSKTSVQNGQSGNTHNGHHMPFANGEVSSPSLLSVRLQGFAYLVRRFLSWPFFLHLTLEVIAFRLRGWCMLSAFLLLAFTPSKAWMSGSFRSVQWNACMHNVDLGLYCYPEELKGQNLCELQWKNPLKRTAWGGIDPWCHIMQESEPNALPVEPSRTRAPLFVFR